jgi:hypothetical protein
VTCPCGAEFEATSPRAVYCSARCRKSGSRAGVKSTDARPGRLVSLPTFKPSPEVVATTPEPDEVPSVVGAVIAELREANALGSAPGLVAVKLAQLIDSATLASGAAPASWARELRAALADAKQGAPAVEDDPVERLRASIRGA